MTSRRDGINESGGGTIVIRRIRRGASGGHHGGAWKVAYADFVTAMMAFFLLLWLLNATSEEQRKGLADYFDPTLPLSPVSAGGSGVLGGEDLFFRAQKAGEIERGLKQRSAVEGSPTGSDFTIDDRSSRADAEAGTEGASSASPDLERLRDTLDDAHLELRLEPDGLVIELSDIAEEPLFAPGSAEPAPILLELTAVVADAIGETAHPVEIIGHTDATPFAGDGYGNWELSSDRAHAARRLMIAAGLAPERLVGVVGMAATRPVSDDPFSPRNRRIAVKLKGFVPLDRP